MIPISPHSTLLLAIMENNNKSNSINLPFPQEKFNKYLSLLSGESKFPSLESIKQLIPHLTKDLLNSNLSVEEYSGVFLHLYNIVLEKDPKSIHSKLSTTLICGWELAYYSKASDQSRYNQMLNQILKFCNFI